MSQNDMTIANSTGATVRADINSAIQALATNNSGSSAPSTTFALQFYADTTNNILKLRNAANDGYVNLFSLAGGVDVDAPSNFNEDVAFQGASANILFDKSANILNFNDNAKAVFGTLSDGLEIFHNASDSIINDSGTGSLKIQLGGSTKAEVVSGGLTVTGTVTATTFSGNATTATTATNATHVSVADNESTNENNLIPFIEDASATGNVGLESDGDFTYNPSTGTVTATKFVGDGSGLTGVGGTTINSNGDNKVITGSGTANTLNAENTLNFDSTGQLRIGHSGSSQLAGLLAQVNIETTAAANLTVKRNSNNEFDPVIGLGKTRATSAGGSTIVQENDRLGSIMFFGSDGNDTGSDAAIIRAEVDGTPGSDDMPGRLLFMTTTDGSNGSSERMRITNKGDVFIGRTSGIDTSEIFGIKGHSGDHCTFGMTINGTTNSSIIGFNDDDANFVGRIQYNHNGDEMGFRVAGGNDAFQIRSDSKCFFNVVNSNIAIDKNSTGTIIDFIKGGSTVGTISISSSSTSYNTSSDYRLKENVVALTDAITRLKTLKPYRFNFISDKDTTVDGFLAHEVTAVPEAITGTKDEVETVYYESNDTIPEGKAIGDVKDTASPVYQGIDQSKLVPLIVAAVQELISKVETLEAA